MPAKLKVSKNFEFILDNFSFEKANIQEKQGFCFEGGSGSSKTWDILQFLIYYCEINRDKKKDILIFRSTFADLRKTVLKDFLKILELYDLYEDDMYFRSAPVSYKLFGNTIYFTGLDSVGSHGERHDVIYGNEAMEIDFDAFRQLNQRCNELFLLDWNPSYTEHWIFNSILTRPDTFYCQSTQLDNPFLPKGQRDEILSYEPTAENISNGTADEYMWKVYGLGIRTAIRGLIFPNVEWVDSFPVDCKYILANDFGYTNDPNALVKIGLNSQGLWIEILCYEPIDNPFAVSEMFNNLKLPKHELIICDSSDKFDDKSFIIDLRNLGWHVKAANKSQGIKYGIGQIKKNKIHIIRNVNAKREAENYKWREINGICINEPIDKFNHMWDAVRYGYTYLENYKNFACC